MKILLIGSQGRLGRTIKTAIENSPDAFLAGEVGSGKTSLKSDITPFLKKADVIIDASTPKALETNLPKILESPLPVVLCSTGHNEEQFKTIKEASKTVPIVLPPNMPKGLRAIIEMLESLSPKGHFHIEDIHHKHKRDAPSGTALTLGEYLPSEPTFSSKREEDAMPTHTIVATYPNETIEIKHKAHGLDLFAESIVETAERMCNKPPGLYNSTAEILEA